MKKCHLCGGDLSALVAQLQGIPKAAQYYPEPHAFAEDTGVSLLIQQCVLCGLVQHAMQPVEYYKEVITAASLSEVSRASRLAQMRSLAEQNGLIGKKVVEIGSGVGEMVDVLQEAGMLATGVEASEQSVEKGRALGRTMVCGYIGDMDVIEGGPFAAFISLNYLEHLPDLSRVLRTIRNNLSPHAVGFVTVPNLGYLLRTKCLYEFVPDHISYFTRETLKLAFEMNGFESLGCWVINNENDVALMVRKRAALHCADQYDIVNQLIEELRQLVSSYTEQGLKVAVWGAGHRTLTLLALSGIRTIEYVIDSAPFKQGKFTPVTHFPIVSPGHLKESPVDLVIVMVPGLYPDEVVRTLKQMNTGAEIAVFRDNKVEVL